jgi:hypothetical protein
MRISLKHVPQKLWHLSTKIYTTSQKTVISAFSYCHVFSELNTGFGLVIGFIALLHFGITNNYSAIANSLTLQSTTARIKSSMSSLGVSWQRILIMSSASVVSGWLPSHNWSSTGHSLAMTNYGAAQSQSHITTDDQSVSGSWFRAPSGAHDQMLITVWHLLFCRYRAPPLTRGRVASLYTCNLSTDRIENIVSNSSSIVSCVTVAAETCLPHSCLAMAASIRSNILAFSRHVTIYMFTRPVRMQCYLVCMILD